MAGWEQARNELNQEQAAQQAAKEQADAAFAKAVETLVSALDPLVRQFVQTLHDHNQWPMHSRQIKEKKGLLFTRFEERTVTEPSSVWIRYEVLRDIPKNAYFDEYALIISSNQEWTFSIVHRNDRNSISDLNPILHRTARGTQVENGYGLPIDLDALRDELIKEMANYLMQRGLPLPRD